jgi:malate dehydrogenase
MVESIIKDKKRVVPCAAYLDGEYGEKGVFIGVPAVIGKDGVEKVVELELDSQEKEAFSANVKHVRELMDATGL